MPDIVGVRFKRAGKVYYFDPAGIELGVNDYVVVQTARGTELGQVTIAHTQIQDSELTTELKPIVSKATQEVIDQAQEFTAKEKATLAECNKIISKLNLNMKLISAEYNMDGSRLTFYFIADARVDFRVLVRELTTFFKTRIELRQIGPRDQAKMIGGLGRCGRNLCCVSFLTDFEPVSIKMAKEQALPLDPMKISGVCGRLQCCLAYESIQYQQAKSMLPRKGQKVATPAGEATVISVNPLKGSILVQTDSQSEVEFPSSQVTILAGGPQPFQTEDEPNQSEEVVPESKSEVNVETIDIKTNDLQVAGLKNESITDSEVKTEG